MKKTLRRRPTWCERGRGNWEKPFCAAFELALCEFAKAFARFNITPGPLRDFFLLFDREWPNNFGGGTEHKGARRDFHPESNERVRANDGAGAYLRAIEHNRTHADEHFVVDLTSVHDGAVADRNELAEQGGKGGIEMDD